VGWGRCRNCRPAIPHPTIVLREADWHWWSGGKDEYCPNGPFDTRECAIDALAGEGVYIVEPCKHDIRFSADTLIELKYSMTTNTSIMTIVNLTVSEAPKMLPRQLARWGRGAKPYPA
jgi:hypothetical protein